MAKNGANSTGASVEEKNLTFAASASWRSRARRVIPGSAHTYSKGDDQFPELSPGFIVRGQGCYVWDVDGNKFIDWSMGLRSVVLGHAYEPVLRVVKEYLSYGCNFARPHPLEVEFAELLCETIPSAEMVKFAKNGSDVTTAAVKLARAYTGRDLIARCADHPFFSVDDWFIGDTPCCAGVPQAIRDLTKKFRYNDIESLKKIFELYPGQIAGVILEAAQNELPQNDFLKNVKDLCRKKGAVLIFDEIITGFRWHAKGAQFYYGVTPDLSTFGKAIGNGFSVSALVGRKDIMELGGIEHNKERVFLLSTTHGGEVHALAAAKKTVEIVIREGVCDHSWMIGKKLCEGLTQAANDAGIAQRVLLQGEPCSPCFTFLDEKGLPSLLLRTLFLQETIRRGVLIPYLAPSYSHTLDDVAKTVEASYQAFGVMRQAIDGGDISPFLVGPVVKPVFRKHN